RRTRREDVRGSHMVGRVRQQRQMSRALDRDRQPALMARARARLPPRLDLAAVRNVSPQLQRVLVVDVLDLVHTEGTDLLALSEAPAPAATATTARRSAEEEHRLRDNFRAISLLAVLALPGARVKPSFDIRLAALLEELAAELGELVPGHHVEPVRLLAPLAFRRVVDAI